MKLGLASQAIAMQQCYIMWKLVTYQFAGAAFVDLPKSGNLIWPNYDGIRVTRRANRLALPNPRKAWERRDGCSLQG
jgi:hypothetical protein